MGTFSIWHWVIVLVVVLVLFGGRGKLSQLMGDMAKGITAFKKGLKDEQSNDSEAKVIERSSEQDTVDVSSTSNKDTAAKS
ncbi:MAG: twin-arginine translocase TatA/TatE family subunit [Rhodospirillaceae bacterium]|jgi:sec-independent protein translocase protein TatA